MYPPYLPVGDIIIAFLMTLSKIFLRQIFLFTNTEQFVIIQTNMSSISVESDDFPVMHQAARRSLSLSLLQVC